MKLLGYTKDDVINMSKNFPQIYILSFDNIKDKIKFIEELGYSNQTVIQMTKKLSTLFGLTNKNIQEKIELYDSLGMHALPIIDTKQLMQSTRLTYSRYLFYKEIGIDINMNNYKLLFASNKSFERKYKMTKEELLSNYNYDEIRRKMR